jgi:hypothetical protein
MFRRAGQNCAAGFARVPMAMDACLRYDSLDIMVTDQLLHWEGVTAMGFLLLCSISSVWLLRQSLRCAAAAADYPFLPTRTKRLSGRQGSESIRAHAADESFVGRLDASIHGPRQMLEKSLSADGRACPVSTLSVSEFIGVDPQAYFNILGTSGK